MRREAPFCVGIVVGLACLCGSVGWAQGDALPVLAEFTLRPGDQPFVHAYTATVDGPHRITASWGTVIPLRLTLLTGTPDPISRDGNPATLDFTAVRGVVYRLSAQGVGALPVTSVGELRGGPVAAAPVPPPGPVLVGVAPGLQPIPTFQPLPPAPPAPGTLAGLIQPLTPAPVGQQALVTVAAGISRETVISALLADPATSPGLQQAGLAAGLTATQLISYGLDRMPVPGGGKTVVQPHPSAPGGPLLPANLLPIEQLDWKKGIRLSPLVDGPYFRQGNEAAPLARWALTGICHQSEEPLPTTLGKGLLNLNFGPGDSLVRLHVALPPGAATYVVTIHLTDVRGNALSAWTQLPASGNLQECRLVVACDQATGPSTPLLSVAPLGGGKGGYAAVVPVPEGADTVGFEIVSFAGWVGAARTQIGGLPFPAGAGPEDPVSPGVFGGITIMRL